MEIGSVIELDIKELFKENKNKLYFPFMEFSEYKYTKFFNTGRSSIEYLYKSFDSSKNYKKSVLVPNYICDSVTDAIKRAGFECEYFKINSDLSINLKDLKKKITSETSSVFICHYFGTFLSNKEVKFLKEIQSNGVTIIEDLSHALYTSNKEKIAFGDYIVASIRKWLPIPDGAVLASKLQIPEYPISKAENAYTLNYLTTQVMKNEYINDPYLQNNPEKKNEFLRFNNIAMDTLFEDYTVREISDISKKYLKIYDINKVRTKRTENYDYLYDNLKNHSEITIIVKRKYGEVPYNFTILSRQRNELRKHLQENNIYCNIHWSLEKEKIDTDKNLKKITDNILTIPCDQRYGKKEMDYILDTISNFYA